MKCIGWILNLPPASTTDPKKGEHVTFKGYFGKNFIIDMLVCEELRPIAFAIHSSTVLLQESDDRGRYSLLHVDENARTGYIVSLVAEVVAERCSASVFAREALPEGGG